MKRTRSILAAALACLLSLTLVMPVFAAKADSSGNVFEADDSIVLKDTALFSAFAAGRKISMTKGTADGSVAAAGMNVLITGSNINETAYLAGDMITLEKTKVRGNIFTAGRKIDISGTSNGIYGTGETIHFSGKTRGLHLAGKNVAIKGVIDGDAEIEAAHLSIDPKIEVTGKLTVRSAVKPEIPASAKIGSFTFKKTASGAKKAEKGEKDAKDSKDSQGSHGSQGSQDEADNTTDNSDSVIVVIAKKVGSTLFWAVAMTLFGMLLCLFFDEDLTKAGDYMMKRPGPSIAMGVAAWLGTPIAILLTLITVILAPIGGILLLVYILLLCAGTAFAGASISRIIFPKMNVFLAAAIGITVLEIVLQIPVLGTIVGILADIYLLSYAVRWLGENIGKRNQKPPQTAAPEDTE